MRNSSEINQKTSAVIAQIGAIDILVNNAGISQRSLVRNATDEVDLALIETNLLGPIRHTKAVLPSMLEQGTGHIVVMSSVTGKLGTPYRSSYAASKHGLHGFFDTLRAEEEKNGINVSIICPGYIHTQVSYNALTDQGDKQGTIDANSSSGMPANIFAKKALRKISKKQAEIVIGGKETMGIYVKRFFPGLLRRIIVNIKP